MPLISTPRAQCAHAIDRDEALADPLYSDIFSCFIEDSQRPFVVAQLGQSLDGRIATVSGDSRYINGEAALDHLHRMRAHTGEDEPHADAASPDSASGGLHDEQRVPVRVA